MYSEHILTNMCCLVCKCFQLFVVFCFPFLKKILLMDQAALRMSLYAGLHDHPHTLIARQSSLFILGNKKFVHFGQAFLWFRAPFSKSSAPTFPSSLNSEEQESKATQPFPAPGKGDIRTSQCRTRIKETLFSHSHLTQ